MREPLQHTRYIYTVLFTIEVVLGMSIIIVTIAYQKVLNAFLVSLERKMLVAKFFNTYVLGFQLVACYLCSLSMWQRLWSRRYTPTLEILLGIWLFFCFLIIISGIATTWSMLYSANSLVNSAELMLFRGIDLYYENPEWKLLWDQLQYGEQCCGVKSYKDWMSAKWMPKNKPPKPPSTQMSVKKERPKERERRSLHRRYHHYQNMPKQDPHYFDTVYPRNYETLEEYPYKNPYQEYVRYDVPSIDPLTDTAFERTLKNKNPIKATNPTIVAVSTGNNANINSVVEQTERTKVYSTTLPTTQSTTVPSTTAHITQSSKLSNSTKKCTDHVFAPYACCKKGNPACYKHYMPQMGNPTNETIPHLNLNDINNNGCLPLFVKHMSYMMAILVVLLMLAILVDVALCSLTKFIMIRNFREGKMMGDNTPLCDDDGNALVLVKCPPNVKCITLEDRDRLCDCDHDFETPQVGSCVYCSTSHMCNECTQCSEQNNTIATENTLLLP